MATVLIANRASSYAELNSHALSQIQSPGKNQTSVDNINDNYEDKLLEEIANLLLQRQITADLLTPRIKLRKGNNRMVIEDPARNFQFEVWRHEDKREEIREKEMHSLLRKFPVPNLLLADFGFEFHGRSYFLRQKDRNEISLADYLYAGGNSINLKLEDIIKGIQTLYDIQCRTEPGVIIRRAWPIEIYTADHTMILPNKEGGYDFKYEITYDVSLKANDNIGLVSYRAVHVEYGCDYPVYLAMAEAARLANATPALVEYIHDKARYIHSPRSIEDVLSGAPLITPKYVLPPCAPPQQIHQPANEKLYLAELATLLVQHKLLITKPELKVMEKNLHWHIVTDQHGRWFEIIWLLKAEDIRELFEVNRILRDKKLPHLITAEFSFDYDDSFGLVFPYYPTGMTLFNALNKGVTLQLKDVLKAVQQLSELFSRIIMPLDQVCAARPLAVTTRRFSSQDLWLIPDGKGGFDFKMMVNSEYCVAKLADDGVGILTYNTEPDDDAYFNVFVQLGQVAEEINDDEELGDIISSLDPYQDDFKERVEEAIAALISLNCVMWEQLR